MAEQQRDRATVLVVEDDTAVRESLTLLLEAAGFRVESFSSAKDFLHRGEPAQSGCLILDVRLPGMSGIELHEELMRRGVTLPTIFLTGHGSPEVSGESRQPGVVAVLEKPCPPDELIEAVGNAIGTVRGSS
jgi:FixJ family two-component response regulator